MPFDPYDRDILYMRGTVLRRQRVRHVQITRL